ncbi:MAG: TIGR01777 family protein [Chloroflexi bacterium]|nr:TIGR01777 family protein [Chloroflexota bacterium]
MRVIVTGGTGLIGTPLVKRLAKSGYDVTVLSRNPAKYKFPEGVRGERWDAESAVGWGHLANGAGAIINLAGESIGGRGFPPLRWTAERKQRILHSRLKAGKAIVAAVRAATSKPHVVIQASGIDYYGNVPDETIITEEAPKGEGFLSDVTWDWENSTAAVKKMGTRQIILRTGLVLSLDGGALPQTMLPFKFFAGGPLGGGKQWLSWIHLEDEIQAIQFLLESSDAAGVYNLCAPNPLPQKQVAKEIGRMMSRPSLIPTPAFALKLILGEMAVMILDGRCALPHRLQEMGFTWQYPHLRDALLDLYNR